MILNINNKNINYKSIDSTIYLNVWPGAIGPLAAAMPRDSTTIEKKGTFANTL
jgi:hypothetical protein